MDPREAAEIKTIITSLLISNPMRATMQQLWRDFREIEGRPVPFQKLGFATFEDYLLSIPDVVQVYGSGPNAEVEGVVTSKTEHINEMVLKQKKTRTKQQKFVISKPKKPFSRYASKNLSTPQFSKCLPETTKKPTFNQPELSTPPNSFKQSEGLFDSNQYFPKTDTKPAYTHLGSSILQNEFKQTGNVSESPRFQRVQNFFQLVEKGMKKSQASDHCQDINSISLKCNDPSTNYLSLTQQNNESAELSFICRNDTQISIDSHFQQCTKKEISSVKSYNDSYSVGIQVTEDLKKVNLSDVNTASTDFKPDYASRVPTKVQINLRQLIQQYPEGLQCSKLPSEYKKAFKKRISYEDYSYRSLIEMCSDLPEIFGYMQYSLHDYLLYDKQKPVPPLGHLEITSNDIQVEKEATTSIFEELPKKEWSISSSLIPTDVLTVSDEVCRFFPADVVVGDILDITIGEIFDLSKFWIYMTFGDLDSLMKDLRIFFEKNHSLYIIPRLLLEEGLYCVTLYNGLYHRCVILSMLVNAPDFLRVFYIDYGTVDNVHVDSIWFLPKQFAEVPAQAMRARMSNICPVYEGRPWPAAAIARFEKLIINRVVVAEVTKVNEKDHVLEVYLADITQEDNIFYINDCLVKEGYALFKDQKRKTCRVDYDCVVNVSNIHLYPVFNDIESGMAPTTEEMKYLVREKIPLHHYMPQCFDIYYDEDIESILIQYESINRKRKFLTFPELDHEEFDSDFFPDCLVDELKQQDKPASKEQKFKQDAIKIESRKDNLIHGVTAKSESFECKDNSYNILSNNSITDLSSSLEKSRYVVSSTKNLQDISVSSGESRLNNSLRNSTNPFVRDLNCSNPFRSTNPFLLDLEETANRNEFVGLFSKSSDETLPQKIVNNLKDSHPETCKTSKQINFEKSPVVDNSAILNLGFDKKEAKTPEETTHRVRTPPGFHSASINRMPFQQNFNQFSHFVPNNNPYYQRFPFVQFNNHAYFGQNQVPAPFVQPFMNTIFNTPHQLPPSQYNFNVSNLQQFYPAHNFTPRFQ